MICGVIMADDGTNSDQKRQIDMAQAVAAHAYGVRTDELLRRDGDDAVHRARQVAMYLAHIVLRLGQRECGRGFGRDHKAVANACRRVEEARKDPAFDRTVQWLESLLRRASGATA
jgi:chromosomal replication initiation ATPase DnaA